MRPEWKEFVDGKWATEVNVRDFIQKNYHPYDGDESFLADATQNTKDLWAMVLDLQKKEREAGGVLDMDTKVVSTIVSRPTSLSRDPYSLTVVSVWQRRLAPTTVMKLILRSASSSPLTERPITQAVSMLTTQR